MTAFNTELFSKVLRLRKAEKELNLVKAAKEIGISQSTLCRVSKRDSMPPDVHTLYKCCAWLGVSADEFSTIKK